MDRVTLLKYIAAVVLAAGGLLLTNGQMGESKIGGLIRALSIMVTFFGGLYLLIGLLGSLLKIIHEHRADRTEHFCPKCGEDLFPPRGQMWSNRPGWNCENCGAKRSITVSAIILPPATVFSRQATRRAIFAEVENLRRKWKETPDADRRPSSTK
jgi:hypothetical protein